MKYAVWFGAADGSRSSTNVPAVVSTTACLGGACARNTDKKQPQRAQRTQKTMFPSALSDLCDLCGCIFSCPRSVHGRVDDPPRVPDVVQARDDGDRQRHPDTDVDNDRVVAEIVEQHRRD